MAVQPEAVTEPGSESERAQSYVIFRLGGEGYALEVMRVQEVLDVGALTQVPGGPKSLRGVLNLRGHVVPVYDLREASIAEVEKRRRLMCRIQTLIREEGAVGIPLWRNVFLAHDKKVKAVRAHPTRYMNYWTAWLEA